MISLSMVAFCILVALSCFAQGIVGFGSTLFATPIALLFLDKGVVVPSMLIVGVVVNLLLVGKIKAKIEKSLIIPLFIASLVGMPIGILLLQSISAGVMKIAVGVLSVIFLIILGIRKTSVSTDKWLVYLSGFLSGILTTSTSINGPPVILFLTGQKVSKDIFRKTLVTFFLLMGVVALVIFAQQGLLSVEKMLYGLASIPFALLGGYLGDLVSKKLPQKTFTALALGFMFITAIYAIYSGVVSL